MLGKSSTARRLRLRRVARAFEFGERPDELERAEQVSVRTILRDLRVVHRVWTGKVQRGSADVNWLLSGSMLRQGTLWRLFEETDDDLVKVGVLDTLRREDAFVLAALLSLAVMSGNDQVH